MPQSFKQIKNRIRGVENTQKVTHAMEMISVSKLRVAEVKLLALREYFLKTESFLRRLLPNVTQAVHPFIVDRQVKKKIALCVITSDTGLCSAYNHNIISLAEDFINKHGAQNLQLICVGKKGYGRPIFLLNNNRFSCFNYVLADAHRSDIILPEQVESVEQSIEAPPQTHIVG